MSLEALGCSVREMRELSRSRPAPFAWRRRECFRLRRYRAWEAIFWYGQERCNTPDIDSTSGLIDLRTETIDASALGFDDCRTYENSEFYYTGNGGIPENPRQFLELQMTVDDLGEIVPVGVNGVDPSSADDRGRMPFAPTPTLTEATTWTIAPDGNISLVSQVPTAATLPQPECN
mgnify:CR=1 FL=1